MVYILSTTLTDHKKIVFELGCLYGIGKFQSVLLCNFLNFGSDRCIFELRQSQIYRLLKYIEVRGLLVENRLQTKERAIVSDLIDLKSYRGIRHIFNLPVRGQRTRTNAKSQKTNLKDA